MAQVSKYEDLYPFLSAELSNCTNPVMLQALQRAGREFCQRTEAWWEQLAPINLVADTVNYRIPSTFDAEIPRIKEVRINTAASIANGDKGSLIDPYYYSFTPIRRRNELGTILAENTLTLDDSLEPDEAVTSGLEVAVYLVPFLASQGADPAFLNKWAEAIVGRALALLLTSPKKPWTNAQQAGVHQFEFIRGVGRARAEKIKGYKSGGYSMKA